MNLLLVVVFCCESDLNVFERAVHFLTAVSTGLDARASREILNENDGQTPQKS
jgi:hypothetical protein